jgi:hypothetical protein
MRRWSRIHIKRIICRTEMWQSGTSYNQIKKGRGTIQRGKQARSHWMLEAIPDDAILCFFARWRWLALAENALNIGGEGDREGKAEELAAEAGLYSVRKLEFISFAFDELSTGKDDEAAEDEDWLSEKHAVMKTMQEHTKQAKQNLTNDAFSCFPSRWCDKFCSAQYPRH